MLDLTSFQKAISQLEGALILCHSDLAKDENLAQHLRAAAIQAFEFTYELAFKTLKRFLETKSSSPSSIREMDFNDIIRRGLGEGILNTDIAEWREFRKNRGTTSHTYDDAKAEEVFSLIPNFLKEAQFLLREIDQQQQITAKNHDTY